MVNAVTRHVRASYFHHLNLIMRIRVYILAIGIYIKSMVQTSEEALDHPMRERRSGQAT